MVPVDQYSLLPEWNVPKSGGLRSLQQGAAFDIGWGRQATSGLLPVRKAASLPREYEGAKGKCTYPCSFPVTGQLKSFAACAEHTRYCTLIKEHFWTKEGAASQPGYGVTVYCFFLSPVWARVTMYVVVYSV